METFFQIAAAAYLLTLAFVVTAKGGGFAIFIFKIAPLSIGAPLALLSFGRVMGWPI